MIGSDFEHIPSIHPHSLSYCEQFIDAIHHFFFLSKCNTLKTLLSVQFKKKNLIISKSYSVSSECGNTKDCEQGFLMSLRHKLVCNLMECNASLFTY